MFSLIEHIEYLMMNHDCVVIPGWGALIAQYSDSFYNEESSVIGKPQRKVGFNPSVNHNDGLLAQSIVRREGITYDEAVRFIADSVTTFKQQLNAEGEVSLGRLGFFHNCDGAADFIPFFHERCNDEYFGLRSINFKTISQLQQEQEAAQEQQEQQESESIVAEVYPTRHSWARRAMQIAASILVLIALVPVLTTPIIKEDSDFASLNLPEVKKPASREIFNWDSAKVDLAVALPADVAIAEKARSDRHAAELAAKQEADEKKAKEELESSIGETSGSGKYYLVVSSLSNEKQVREYMGSHTDLKGKMQVLRRGNKYRIYVARDNSHSALAKARAALPERYSDAWICD